MLYTQICGQAKCISMHNCSCNYRIVLVIQIFKAISIFASLHTGFSIIHSSSYFNCQWKYGTGPVCIDLVKISFVKHSGRRFTILHFKGKTIRKKTVKVCYKMNSIQCNSQFYKLNTWATICSNDAS